VVAKLREEVEEVEEAIRSGDGDRVAERSGPALRRGQPRPIREAGSRGASLRGRREFRRRFDRVVELLRERGSSPNRRAARADRLWEAVKLEERI